MTMEEQRYYTNLYQLSPPYPLTLLQFLKNQLQLGKRYVVMEVHTHNGQWSKLLHKHVHLMCSLCTDPAYQVHLQEQFADSDHFLSLNALPDMTTIDDDSIDCLCIDATFHHYDPERMRKEFERIMRLNSYVLIAQHERAEVPGSFTAAYGEWLEAHANIAAKTVLPDSSQLERFYPNPYQKEVFESQQRLNWEQLEEYARTHLTQFGRSLSPEGRAALRQLYDQHQRNERVALDYHTHVYYGVFNHVVEEVPWHQAVFFTLLRPFAFVLYLLLKARIYVGKGLKALFRGKRTQRREP